jgi:hypothetical protein
LIDGDIAEGGGELTVVSEVVFEFTVLVVVDSVTIGSAIATVPVNIAITVAITMIDLVIMVAFLS